jgi:putative hemolysin
MVKRNPFLLLLALTAATLLLAGCARFFGEGTPPTPTAEPQDEGPRTPQEVLAARRAVLDFLRQSANECVPPPGVIWEDMPGTAPDGFDVYRYDSEGCLMTVSYPQPQEEETLYHVTLHNRVSGFCWQANVDAGGSVVATGVEAGMLPELSNAAAAYCAEQGYAYEEAEQSDGVRCGVCVFDDGQSCNAWAFFQGMCSPDS